MPWPEIFEKVLDIRVTGCEMIVFELDPNSYCDPAHASNNFYWRNIIREVPVKPEKAAQVREELSAMIKNWEGVSLKAFNPRYGVRITKGNRIWEFAISYDCHQMRARTHARDGKSRDKGLNTEVKYGVDAATPILSDLLKDPASPTK